MFLNGRVADQVFSGSERLFIRLDLDWIDSEGGIKISKIRVPNQSVNREKYSKKADVLLPADDDGKSRNWILGGVASLAVESIPTTLQSPGDVAYEFGVTHDPQDDNYGHAELSAYKARERQDRINSNALKKAYRTTVALKMSILVRPLV